jgi:nitroreductase
MPAPNPAALDLLLTRQSRPARSLTLPVPSRDQLTTLLTAAARVPDHGKLVPWRFIVLERGALDRLAALVPIRGEALGIDPEKIAKSTAQYRDADLAVVVVGCPRGTDRIPAIEQTLSAGAVCMTLLAAATAAGWGANWLTGWPVYDADFTGKGLGLTGEEWVAGVIHIGTASADFPDRPRPDIAAITTWAPA